MKKLAIGLALVMLAVNAGFGLAQEGIRLALPGQWHGDEVAAEDGESWLALVERTPDRYELRPVTLRVERVHDPIVDDTGEKTGKRISLNLDIEPVILIQGLPIPEQGVSAVQEDFQPFIAFERDRPHGRLASERIPLTEDSWLQLEAVPFPEDERFSKIKLTYVEGMNKQVLDVGEIPVSADVQPGLMWAGDLDGDGYTDLLLNTSNHYNVDAITLFLSGPAEKGRLLKKVAEWRTTGC